MNEPSPLKDAIMDAVYTPLERDDMQTPCALPFMTSTEYGVCDGDGCPVSDETIASALNAVAKIQAEYYKVKKGTQKGTQKEMTNEPSPRPWHNGESICGTRSCIHDANGEHIASCFGMSTEADAALIVAAVNERAKLEEVHMEFPDLRPVIIAAGQRDAAIAERDRLRDIVRRMAKIIGESPIDWYGANFVEKQVLLAEARAAIGEGEKK